MHANINQIHGWRTASKTSQLLAKRDCTHGGLALWCASCRETVADEVAQGDATAKDIKRLKARIAQLESMC